MADVNRLIERFPDLPEALYMRSNLHRMNGDMRSAERDYNKALAMSKKSQRSGYQVTTDFGCRKCGGWKDRRRSGQQLRKGN